MEQPKRPQDQPTTISAVVAMAANRVIGDGDGLIWHLPGDLKRVKAITMGCPLIMGRKTWDSIGRPLPGRGSIVLTRDKQWRANGAVAVNSWDAAIIASKNWIAAKNVKCKKIILFGGGEVYRIGINYCHQIDMTFIEACPDGGQHAALFPELDSTCWTCEMEARAEAMGDVPAYRYEKWQRLRQPLAI